MAFTFFKKKETADPKKKKPVWREWLDAALFAVVAATIIRTFIFEAYTIPTGSMEGSMLVNDYLFVSKLSYGPRIPNTPVALPLVHNTMPITGGLSYTDAVQWAYHRLPGFGDVERYDVVVFNYPAGDTVIEERPADDYYSILRDDFGGDRAAMNARYKIITRPVDKKENYIKRCVGMPGDKLEIKDAVLYTNDQIATQYPHQKFLFIVNPKGNNGLYNMLEELEVEPPVANNIYFLENRQVAELRKHPEMADVIPYLSPKGVAENGVFPQDTVNFKFNKDNFGPIIVPKAGTTVALSPANIALYRRIIRNYEKNKLEERDGKIYINDKEATSYTFKMSYYWMMGDNRHNSLDSRYWGFVPQDHIVGKAWFVWFSYSKEGLSSGIRWKRLFRSVHSLEK